MAKKQVKKKTAPKRSAKPLKKKTKKTISKTRRVAKPTRKRAAARARPRVRKLVRTPAKAVRKTPKVTKKTKTRRPVKKVVAPPVKKAVPARKAAVPPPARLQRERRRLPEVETGDDSRLMSSARSGHDGLRAELKMHTEASPELTAGDVDAKWQDAYALGDEAPGGDNMTPDQDRVDDIGKALGVEYDDDQELMGGEEITERDEHRWELDPASKEDEDE